MVFSLLLLCKIRVNCAIFSVNCRLGFHAQRYSDLKAFTLGGFVVAVDDAVNLTWVKVVSDCPSVNGVTTCNKVLFDLVACLDLSHGFSPMEWL